MQEHGHKEEFYKGGGMLSWLLHSKGYLWQNEKTNYWIGENIYNDVSDKGLNIQNIKIAHTA